MTTELFMQWKQKKIAESEPNMDAQRAERAKNDVVVSSSLQMLAYLLMMLKTMTSTKEKKNQNKRSRMMLDNS
ncbi:hypothetical protein ACS0TY_016105 [Phlomoides rotata]